MIEKLLAMGAHIQRNKTRYGAILIGLGGIIAADAESMKVAGHIDTAFWFNYLGGKLVIVGGMLTSTGLVKSDQYFRDKAKTPPTQEEIQKTLELEQAEEEMRVARAKVDALRLDK